MFLSCLILGIREIMAFQVTQPVMGRKMYAMYSVVSVRSVKMVPTALSFHPHSLEAMEGRRKEEKNLRHREDKESIFTGVDKLVKKGPSPSLYRGKLLCGFVPLHQGFFQPTSSFSNSRVSSAFWKKPT